MTGHDSGSNVERPATGRSFAWTQYLSWNRAVADVIYPVANDPVPAYMDLEDDELAKIASSADYHGADPGAELASVVRAVTVGSSGKFALSALTTDSRRWLAQTVKKKTTEPPPCLAFLAVTVLAAEAMGNDEENLASLAYYARLARLLKLPDNDGHLRNQYPRHAEYLWRCVNVWLESVDGERGLPTAYALTYRFVGLPMSQ